MVRRAVLLGWFISFSVAQAGDCRLEKDQTIRIGCTTDCAWIVKKRIKNSAKKLGYKVSFQNLSKTSDHGDALRSVDAVIIQGGADINPDYYVQDLPDEVRAEIESVRHLYNASKEGDRRDPFEYGVSTTYLSQSEFSNLPLLGICRGMQMLTVASGIPLYVDLKTEIGIKNPKRKFQSFQTLDEDSLMGELFGSGAGWAWQNHHQGLRYDYFKKHSHLYPTVQVTASSHRDRVVEAIEFTDRPAIGVQFHPESSQPKIAKRVFRWLLNNACEKIKKDGK